MQKCSYPVKDQGITTKIFNKKNFLLGEGSLDISSEKILKWLK